MRYYKEKLFWKIEDKEKKVFLIEYDETQEYYSFIRKMVEDKCHQITITSDIMLSYIEEIALLSDISIEKIEMMEDDNELIQEVEELVKRCEKNRGAIVELIKKLKHLDEDSSIEIKRIYLREVSGENKILGYVQVNGIVGITAGNSSIIDALLRCVKEYIC